MQLALTPESGGEALPFTPANKFFKSEKDDAFRIKVDQEVAVHTGQFQKVDRDGKPGYFLMWGVSQIFNNIEPGKYLAKASFTIRDGTWTGTLISNTVLVVLP
jgi:hypothetical protein